MTSPAPPTGPARSARRRFRPGLWSSLFVALGVLILLGLSAWQLQRLSWKRALIAEVEAQLAADPKPLPAAIADPPSWTYRPVISTGRYDHDGELLLEARSLDGQPGRHVLTPLIRESGPPVLIDRGWVPITAKAGDWRRPEGPQRINGIARTPPGQGFMQPDNPADAAKEGWYWIDLAAMAEASGQPRLAPVFIEIAADQEADPDTGVLPIGGRSRVSFSNNHLSYAVFWAAMALALIGVWALASYRKADMAAPSPH